MSAAHWGGGLKTAQLLKRMLYTTGEWGCTSPTEAAAHHSGVRAEQLHTNMGRWAIQRLEGMLHTTGEGGGGPLSSRRGCCKPQEEEKLGTAKFLERQLPIMGEGASKFNERLLHTTAGVWSCTTQGETAVSCRGGRYPSPRHRGRGGGGASQLLERLLQTTVGGRAAQHQERLLHTTGAGVLQFLEKQAAAHLGRRDFTVPG
jgi:hypothetical protein